MIRAKFRCNGHRRFMQGTKDGQPVIGLEVLMNPVYSTDPNHENKKFWEATPAGELRMTVSDERVFEGFEAGQEYYVDFTPAPMS